MTNQIGQKQRMNRELKESEDWMPKTLKTICHTEVCITFSRLAAKLSEVSKKSQGRSLKIQPRTSFDLNDLKNNPSKHFESRNAFVPKIDGS